MSVVDDISGVDVDNNYVAVEKEETFIFIYFLHAFAYVFDLGLPSKLVVNNET